MAVELSRAPPLRSTDTAILLALINDHLVRLLRVASSMHHLDSAALAIQVCSKLLFLAAMPVAPGALWLVTNTHSLEPVSRGVCVVSDSGPVLVVVRRLLPAFWQLVPVMVSI